MRGIIQSWNRGAERMFGYTVAEAVGKSVSMLAVPGRLDEIPDILQRIARGERIDHYQTQRQTKDGRVLVISLTVSPIHDAAGKVIGASKIARDVTELVDYQNALRQSESSFRQLADSMPHMVWTATPEGNVDYYNRHWHDYAGMSLDQSRNWGWQPVLHPSHLQSTIDPWTHSFTSGEPFKVECLLKRASDGAYRWHLSQARPVRDTQGKIVRWFGACSDVDDYKQAASENQTLNEHLETRVRERTAELDFANQQLSHANAELHVPALRLEQTNRELQDFASVTSHDLQEPLRKVQAFGDRLNIECRRQIHERGRGYLDRMLNSTKRMQSLIEDLLRFAHVTSQARPFFPVDLAQVAREVVSDLEVRILETKALVQLGALPTIDADAVQMRQLLQNLIGNPLKFHLPGVPPVVRVYAESFDSPAAEPMIRLIVHDKGIGFDEKSSTGSLPFSSACTTKPNTQAPESA